MKLSVNQQGTLWLYSKGEGILKSQIGKVSEVKLRTDGSIHAVDVRSLETGLFFRMREVRGELRTDAVIHSGSASTLKYKVLFDVEDNFYVVHNDQIVRSDIDLSTPEWEWE